MSSKNATVSALEKGPNPSKPEREQGYSALAKYMAASTADNSTLIFRRFDQLNARNLLVLESQISSHEARLASLEKELESKPVSAEWLKEWDVLCQQAQIDDDEVKSASRECAKEIVDLSRELEGLLGKYYEALLRTAEIQKLPAPRPKALYSLRDALHGVPGKTELTAPREWMLQGVMGHHLNPSDEADLSSLVQWQSVDPVSRFLQRPKSSTPLETRQRITHLVSTLSALVVSLFLVTAIVALYFISNPTARLGTLCAFIVVFAANLAIFTSCRRYEVFVATAAYAAVLVVFVSGDFSAASNNIINNLYGANGTPDLMGSGGVGTAVVAPQTVTQIVYATDVKTATPVVTQVVETVQVTIVETATATSTSAAAKKKGWFNRFSTQIKVGVALGIAVAAAVGLCIGGYGLFLLSASVAASGLWVVRAGKKWIGRSKTGSAE